MMYVELSDSEYRDAKRAAASLIMHWIDRYPTKAGRFQAWRQTLYGLGAERAVIKCLKETWGYTGEITFRDYYETPTDGGHDFTFEGMTCDVKLTGKGKRLPAAHVSGKAKIYFLVGTEKSPRKFHVIGFAPYSRMRPVDGVYPWCTFKGIERLKAAFPDKFGATQWAPEKKRGGCERIGSVVSDLVDDIFVHQSINGGLA